MSTIAYRTPELPWAEGKSESLFNKILILGLIVTLALGILIPNITLPEIKREKAEKLPPQLAKVIKRKKEAPKPKPKPVPKVQEKKVEKKPEPKKQEAKPKPAPKKVVKPKPKPKPKPKTVTKRERTPERIADAKKKAKGLISEFSSNLDDMKSFMSELSLDVDSSSLSNAGSAATAVGSVVDESAVGRVAGVDESTLTRATGAENLAVADRDTTKVKELPKDTMGASTADQAIAGSSRTEMQVRRVFEQSTSKFNRIFKRALRSDPTLQGSVDFNLTVSADGQVTGCDVVSSEFADKKALKKMESLCKRMTFPSGKSEDKISLPIAFYP